VKNIDVHLRRGVLQLLAAATLVGCAFTSVYAVANLSGTRVVGMIAVDNVGEAERAYVGLADTGTEWDAVARLTAINVTNGAIVASVPGQSGGGNIRAIAADLGDDTVWTISDNGDLRHWTKDIAPIATQPSYFTGPFPENPVARWCDMEALGYGNCFAATGLSEATTWYDGFIEIACPNASPNGRSEHWIVFSRVYKSTGLELGTACPRVSRDPYDTEGKNLSILAPKGIGSQPDVAYYRLRKSHQQQDGGDWYLADFINYFNLPVLSKIPNMVYSDIASSQSLGGFIVLQRSEGAYPGYMRMYQTDVGHTPTLLSSKTFTRLQALTISDWTDAHGGAVWWYGYDSTSGYELGTVVVDSGAAAAMLGGEPAFAGEAPNLTDTVAGGDGTSELIIDSPSAVYIAVYGDDYRLVPLQETP
jgi:hypothetical protein